MSRGKTAVSSGKQPVVLTEHRCPKCAERILTTELAPVITLEPKPSGRGMRRFFAYFHKGCR